MTDIFISYARSTADQAHKVAEALRALGYGVWRDDELPAHRAYAEVIEERLTAAKAVVVIWSAEAVKSQWVFSEANRAREGAKLVQLSLDATRLPMPFDTLQCADMAGWDGDTNAPGWREVVASLGDLMGAPSTPTVEAPALALPSKPSIAVMPFANLSGDPEQDYFADGMLVEIVEALSRCRSIFVIASGSSLSFKGKGVSAQEAARQLGVRYILEGNVRKAGNRVRIGVQLIDAAENLPIWTQRFEETLEDIFDLQDKVALAVAGRIEPTVESSEIRRASARPTDKLSSYDLYLRALPLSRTYGKEGSLEALSLLKQAIALDPGFGLALAVAASCLRNLVLNGWSNDPEDARRQIIDLTSLAVKAAGDDAVVLAISAGAMAYVDDSPTTGFSWVDRALALNPGSSTSWSLSGMLRVRAGQLDLGIAQPETALRLDPASARRVNQLGCLGQARFLQGRFAEAIELLDEAEQLGNAHFLPAFTAASFGHLGQVEQAQAALRRWRKATSQSATEYARTLMTDPAHRKLFLEGIALAEGKEPPESSSAP